LLRELELPRSELGPLLARRALARWYGLFLDDDELADATTIVSELVTNAVVHGTGQIHLRTDLDADRLVVHVIDEGSGFEHKARQVPADQLHGRGLLIVDATSSRWGIYEGTTHVWAEVERSGPRLGDEKAPET
jgi:anti-sigma regulatory factor (Ser/Thr protein kinase)